MRYRWNSEAQLEIAETWDTVCRNKFRTMMSSANTLYREGLKKNQLWRPSWMEPPMFNIARKRWDSQASMQQSIQKAKNRGVKFDLDGKVVEKAPPRHFGGAISTLEIALQMVCVIDFLSFSFI